MSKSCAGRIAGAVLELLLSDNLFSVYNAGNGECHIVWSSATKEMIAARIHEGLINDKRQV